MGVLEIPFAQNSAGYSGIGIDSYRAQANIQWKFENALTAKIGAFRVPMGLESNFSNKRGLTVESRGYRLLPWQNLGLELGYLMSESLSFYGFIGNPADRGKYSSNPTPFEYGARMTSNFLDYTSTLAYQTEKPFGVLGQTSKADPGNFKTGYVVNITAKTQMNLLNFGIDLVLRKPATDKDGQILESSLENASFQKASLAKTAALFVELQISKKIQWKALVDYGVGTVFNKNIITFNTQDKSVGITVGPTYLVAEDLFVRADMGLHRDSYHLRTQQGLGEKNSRKTILALGVSAVQNF